MADLVLPVKRIYFEQMRDGTKLTENRLTTPFWTKRLVGRAYDRVIITLGYPKRGDPERTLIFPWRGYTVQTITHPHFGDKPVEVFAITVGGNRLPLGGDDTMTEEEEFADTLAQM